MSHLRRLGVVGAVLVVVALVATLVPAALNPAPPSEEKRRRDTQWVASSPYWLDRQACRFVGLCGVMHLRWDPPYVVPGSVPFEEDETGWVPRLELRRRGWEESVGEEEKEKEDGDETGTPSGDSIPGGSMPANLPDDSEEPFPPRQPAAGRKSSRKPAKLSKEDSRRKAALKDIPDYVLKHAPLVHLSSEEHFWPADIMEHVRHLSPYYENEAMNSSIDLSNLHRLNSRSGLVSLRSDDDVEGRPDWLYSEVGIPVPFNDPLTEADLVEQPARLPTGRRPKDSTWQDVNRDVPLHHIADPETRPGRRPPGRHGLPFAPQSEEGQDGQDGNGGDYDDDDNDDRRQLLRRWSNTTYEGYSSAPAVLVMVEKSPGVLDAYWFFFYSYNLGQTVARLRFGNHVGDWEHCMVRFQDGVPRAVFLSEHEGGQAFEFGAMSRYRRFPDRPVIFSAVGSHAMYALPGKHPYVLPFGMLADETDRGPLWDPAKNTYAYHYDYAADPDRDSGGAYLEDGDEAGAGTGEPPAGGVLLSTAAGINDPAASSGTDDDQVVIGEPGRSRGEEPNKSLVPAASNPDAPTSWFHFTGVWGDNLYPLADTRQWRLFMQYHYVTGPRGPKDKNLDREKMCPRFECRLLDHLDPKGKWY
jgi:hypothetical protein